MGDLRFSQPSPPYEFLQVAQGSIRQGREADEHQGMKTAQPYCKTIMDQEPHPAEEVPAVPQF